MNPFVRTFLASLIMVATVSAPALAQQTAAPKPPARAAIKAGKLLDVRTGRYVSNVFIMVEGERIVSTGTAAPAGMPVIDLSNSTVLPGLIDAHNHILGNPKDALRDSVKMGLIRGPRMVSAGNCISVTGGHGDDDALAPDQSLLRRPNLADSVGQISTAVRRDIKYGADWIKLMATGGVMDPHSDYRTQELSEEQMARAVEAAHRAGKKVMAHAEGTEGIKAAVRAGVDSIEHGTVLDEEGAALMERKGTWLVPTLYTFQHGAEQGTSLGADPIMAEKGKAILALQQPAFALALKHHLKIAYGVDDDPDFVSKEFGALVRGGMTALAAIQAATINAAELLGWTKDAGTIEEGKFADIIAVSGDPLANITVMEKVTFVMKGGEVMKNEVKR